MTIGLASIQSFQGFRAQNSGAGRDRSKTLVCLILKMRNLKGSGEVLSYV